MARHWQKGLRTTAEIGGHKVPVRRLSANTKIIDLDRRIWPWLRMYGWTHGWTGDNTLRGKIGDLPHEVWQCDYAERRFYGRTLIELIEAAKLGGSK